MAKFHAARGLCLAAMAPLALCNPPAMADSVNGSGSAAISKDVDTVRNSAELDARRAIVREMLMHTLGEKRSAEVTPSQVDRFAGQIRPEMITGRSTSRSGSTFTVTLTADIDQAWFRSMLGDADIDSASQRADGDAHMVLVYIDREDGTASDLSKPAVVDVNYDRHTGDSFSDHSTVTASSREASAASSLRAAASSHSAAGAQQGSANGAYSERSAAAYGASGPDGSAAGNARSSSSGGYSGQSSSAFAAKSASASVAKSANAHSASSNFADRTKVDAETHDDVSYQAHVVYQQGPKEADGDAAIIGLSGALLHYDVQVSNARMAMADYFHGAPPRYGQLKNDPRFSPFLSFIATRNSPYFLGGKLALVQNGIDSASGQSQCSGTLEASANASEDGRMLGGGTYVDTALGGSPEECASRLTVKLADLAGAAIGPQIQNNWRKRAIALTGHVSTEAAGYALVLRAAHLDMAMQADLMDALSTLPGASNPAFVSSSATELRINVTYAGATPLQFAVFQKLRDKPAFAQMQASSDGRSVLLCLQGCGAAH
jgi:hypothetical protein